MRDLLETGLKETIQPYASGNIAVQTSHTAAGRTTEIRARFQDRTGQKQEILTSFPDIHAMLVGAEYLEEVARFLCHIKRDLIERYG